MRLARGVNPSIVKSFLEPSGVQPTPGSSYVHISPMVLGSSLEAARAHATTVAAKYGVRSWGSQRLEPPQKDLKGALQQNQFNQVVHKEQEQIKVSTSSPVRLLDTPSTPPPLHRAKPRTFLYDQFNESTSKLQASPDSVTHSSPTSQRYHSGEKESRPGHASSRRSRSTRVEVAHEIVELVKELRGKLL